MARGEVVDREDLSEDRVRLTIRVEAVFQERTFQVTLVREEFQETFDEAGLLEDGYVAWSEIARQVDGHLQVRVPMPAGTSTDEITLLRAGREWKLDGFAPGPPSSPPPDSRP